MASLKKCTVVFIIATCTIAIFAVVVPRIWSSRGRNMSCIFCDIISKKAEAELLYEDETFVAFKDIRPASQFHFLIIPRKHIVNTSTLTVADKPMVEDMKRIMIELLEKNNQTNTSEILLGFHVPPFNSIKHLHLHGIAPTSGMNMIRRWTYRPDSYWFKTADTIIDSLKETS